MNSPTGLAYDPTENRLLIASNGGLEDVSVPLNVGNVAVTNLSSGSVTIQWTTDGNASSQVEFGLTAGYGQTSSLVTTAAQNQAITLLGLLPATTYHFRVVSQDASGEVNMSEDYTFTT